MMFDRMKIDGCRPQPSWPLTDLIDRKGWPDSRRIYMIR